MTERGTGSIWMHLQTVCSIELHMYSQDSSGSKLWVETTATLTIANIMTMMVRENRPNNASFCFAEICTLQRRLQGIEITWEF